jgi:hypothetical protein
MRRAAFLAGAAFALAALTACGSGSSHSSVHAAISSAAANPTVRADTERAQNLVTGCQKQHPTLKGTEACVQARVPKARRDAAGKCLAVTYTADLEHATGKGAKGKARDAWAVFTASDIPGIGAQPCVVAALA